MKSSWTSEAEKEALSYHAPWYLPGGHIQTIYPFLFRRVEPIAVHGERIDTPDGDFLDLDWTPRKGDRIAIICHGLEGSSRERYAQGMAKALYSHNWDALCWNFRGCSGEPNRALRSYHSGSIDDLQIVIDHIFERGYETVVLIGFSLGGNLLLKYLGELGSNVDQRIKAATAFSVPCDLAASSRQLAKPSNSVYMARFMRSLREKIKAKAKAFPEELDTSDLSSMRTFLEFDDKYTAPLNGFADAMDYWTKCSCKFVLDGIRVPTLLVNAKNDPFLTPECYPDAIARGNRFFDLEMPDAGGHVGFPPQLKNGLYWPELRTIRFLEKTVS